MQAEMEKPPAEEEVARWRTEDSHRIRDLAKQMDEDSEFDDDDDEDEEAEETAKTPPVWQPRTQDDSQAAQDDSQEAQQQLQQHEQSMRSWSQYLANPMVRANPMVQREAYMVQNNQAYLGYQRQQQFHHQSLPMLPAFGHGHTASAPALGSLEAGAGLPPPPPSTGKKKKTPAKNKTSKEQTKKLSNHFTEAEAEALSQTVLDILPIGPEMWETVVNTYNASHPGRERDDPSLRRKYNLMLKSQKPTGNPNCPNSIRLAKRANYKIIERSEACVDFSDGDGAAVPPPMSDNEEADIAEDGESGDSGKEPTGNTPGTGKEGTQSSTSDDGNLSALEKVLKRKQRPVGRAAKTKNKKPKNKKGNTKKDGDEEPLSTFDLYLVQQEERRTREEERQRREDAKEEREEKRARRQQEMLLGLVTSAVSAFTSAMTGNPAPTSHPAGASLPPRTATSSDESISSINSCDSPPAARKKAEIFKRKYAKLKALQK